jgi:hypothetical protein
MRPILRLGIDFHACLAKFCDGDIDVGHPKRKSYIVRRPRKPFSLMDGEMNTPGKQAQ